MKGYNTPSIILHVKPVFMHAVLPLPRGRQPSCKPGDHARGRVFEPYRSLVDGSLVHVSEQVGMLSFVGMAFPLIRGILLGLQVLHEHDVRSRDF